MSSWHLTPNILWNAFRTHHIRWCIVIWRAFVMLDLSIILISRLLVEWQQNVCHVNEAHVCCSRGNSKQNGNHSVWRRQQENENVPNNYRKFTINLNLMNKIDIKLINLIPSEEWGLSFMSLRWKVICKRVYINMCVCVLKSFLTNCILQDTYTKSHSIFCGFQ